MSRYSLNHGYTCPLIDRNISDAKDIINNTFYNTLEELCPVIDMDSPEAREWIKVATENLYSGLESVFEDLRSTNEDLRSAAEQQIAECVSELEEAEYRLQELED